MIDTEILVVGGGLAGLRAAIECCPRADTALISQVHPLRSHSAAAQGGINAALANNPEGRDDTPERHAFDTVKGSDYLADQDAAEFLTADAPERVIESEHFGVAYSRMEDGRIAQRPFGGAGFPRTCYAADRTGLVMLHTLYEQCVRRRLKVYYEWVVTALVVEEGVCRGAIALDLLTGRLEAFRARAVIFATGGAGRLYARTTNSMINTGSGMAIAYQAGLPLKDMEFVQFHPTTLFGTGILMSEGARGEGAYLVNAQGKRFMQDYAPNMMELAPRDITARAIETEIEQGRGFPGGYVNLDLRHLGKRRLMERLPEITDLAIQFAGVNPVRQPVPIRPGQHYTMGGIACDIEGATEAEGFFAAGECACVSVHGANRLGGNSLLETVVFGRRTGAYVLNWLEGAPSKSDPRPLEEALGRERQRVERLLRRDGGESPAAIRDELRELMQEKVGVFREAGPLQEACDGVARLKERCTRAGLSYHGSRFNLDLLRTLQLGSELELAEVVAQGALRRQESRGSHFRRDFPQRDDEHWLKHTIARWAPDGPKLEDRPVTITRWPPKAREY